MRRWRGADRGGRGLAGKWREEVMQGGTGGEGREKKKVEDTEGKLVMLLEEME